MGNHPRQEHLRAAVSVLLETERKIEIESTRMRESVKAFPPAGIVLQEAISRAREHAGALETYLAGVPSSEGGAVPDLVMPPASMQLGSPGKAGVSAILQAEYALLGSTALGYAALFELALRLYEPPLRELAPKHLKAWARSAQSLAELVPATVTWELEAESGLGCHCICPMCGMGACGCVALGRQAIITGWREAIIDDEGAGFPLQHPRADTPLAQAGIMDGDRLLEVDGQPVRKIPEIQAALRKHAIGEDVRLLVGREVKQARELHVRHVSDYP